MLPLDSVMEFDAARAEELLLAVPARAAVVVIEPRAEFSGGRSLLLRTTDLRRRLRLLLGPVDPESRRVNLRDYAGTIRFRLTGSAFEQALVQWQQARSLWKANYRQRLRLRLPALVKLNTATAYPRAYVTRRLTPSGLYFGPFATVRAADSFLESSLELFRIRRCQIKILRDPNFPGCIYSEMKMCMAPCFAGCSAEEYAGEVGRVTAFLRTSGASLAQELSSQREEASAALDFERAAALHRRLEKLEALQRNVPELMRQIDKLHAVILQRAAGEHSVAVFLVRAGRIADPLFIEFDQLAGEPRSVEQILRGHFEQTFAQSGTDQAPSFFPQGREATAEREDHLALLSRWFYARPREGEMFLEQPQPVGWPYRRILRACSRVLQATAAGPQKPLAPGTGSS